jgi:aminoglycoside phosphotransferase (APT) family kinase protein
VKVIRQRHRGAEERARLAARVETDFRKTQRVYDAMPVGQGLSVVRPVVCYPDHLAIVTEEARGHTLLQLLESKARWWPADPVRAQLIRTFRRTGEWLRAFQQIPVASQDDQVTLPRLAEYVRIRLDRLARLSRSGISAAEADRIHTAILNRLADLATDRATPVAIHGDVAFGNVLATAEAIVVLDLVMTTKGTPYHDVAHLYMQLDLLQFKPHFRPGIVASLQEALLTGFARPDIVTDPLFEVLHTLHAANHLLGLVERPAGVFERLYNSRLIGRHRRWLRRFAASAPGA